MATSTIKPVKGKAILFGLNYSNIPGATLQGCINDVVKMGAFIKTNVGIPVTIYTDEANPNDTTLQGIMSIKQCASTERAWHSGPAACILAAEYFRYMNIIKYNLSHL